MGKATATAARIAAIGALVLWLTACTSTVRCPIESDNPRSIFLLDHGHHRTLVLSDGKGGLQRYGYGDWRYYAEADRGFFSGARALLWPTPAALGRREYTVSVATRQEVVSAVKVIINELYQFQVAGDAVDELRRELDSTFDRGAKKQYLENDLRDFEFALHPRGYSLRYSSNHMVTEWLETLGCDVNGPVSISVRMRQR